MPAVPMALEGEHNDLAIMAAELKRQMGDKRSLDLQIAYAHLLNYLGHRLHERADPKRLPMLVYVAQSGDRVITLCFRRYRDSASLQIAYDSAVERA